MNASRTLRFSRLTNRHRFTDLGLRWCICFAMALPLPAVVNSFNNRAEAWWPNESDADDTADPNCQKCPRPPKCPGAPSPGAFGAGLGGLLIHLLRGSVVETVTDIQIETVAGSWGHTRTYDSVFHYPTGTGQNYQGEKWRSDIDAMHVIDVSGGVDVFLSASTKRSFTGSSSPYTAPADYRATLTKTGTGADARYRLVETDTQCVYTFYGTNTSIDDALRGRLYSIDTLQHESTGLAPTDFVYDANGNLNYVYFAETQANVLDYYADYDYITTGDETGQLKSVELIKTGTATTVAKVEYTYYGSVSPETPSSDLGTDGDLVQVKVSKLASDDTTWITRYTQYRYSGTTHQLTHVFEPDAVERIVQAGGLSSPEKILEKGNTDLVSGEQLNKYASRRFSHYTSDLDTDVAQTTPWGDHDLEAKYGFVNVDEYPFATTARVNTEIVGPGCASCGGSGGLTYTYFHLTARHPDNTPQGVDHLVIEDAEDANGAEVHRRIWGLNYKGVVLREVFIDDATGTTGLKAWCQSRILDSDMRVIEERMPSAHTLVDSDTEIKEFLDPTGDSGNNDGDTLNDSTGVIYVTEYDSDGNPDNQLVKKGENGTTYYLSATDWSNHGANGEIHYLPDTSYAYPTQVEANAMHTNRGNGIETDFTYTFWDSDKLLVKTRTTKLPAIGTTQNGAGSSESDRTTLEEYIDKLGRLRWTVDGEGYINYYSYHPITQGQAFTMVDVDDPASPGGEITSGSSGKWEAWTVGDANSNKPTRGSGLPTGLELVSKTEFDDLGRVTKSIDTGGSEHVTKYYKNGIARFAYVDSNVAKLPVRVSKIDDGGKLTESIEIDPTSGFDTTDTSIPTTTSTYVTRTVYSYDSVDGQLEHVDRYYDISGSKKYRTTYFYDEQGRRAATIQDVDTESTPKSYQVTLNLFDDLGRITETHHDAVSTKPANYAALFSSGTPVSSFAKLSVTEYDSDGVGDGHVTKQTQYHTSSVYTEMTYKRTYRGHVRGVHREYTDSTTDDVKPYSVVDIDWMGRTTDSAQYAWTMTDWGDVLTGDGYTDYIASNGSNRINWTATKHDDLGRVYQTLRYPGTQSARWFEFNNYYDRRGKLVASGDRYGAHQEMAYDGAGRQYQTRIVKDVSSTDPYDANGLFKYNAPDPDPDFSELDGGDEGVIELDHSDLDEVGNALAIHHVEVNHNDTDSNGIAFAKATAAGKPVGGVRTTTHNYYDAADRLETSVYYGAGAHNDGATTWKTANLPTRATGTHTSFESTVDRLVTQYDYNDDSGRLELTKDPENTSSVTSQNKTLYDDLGRRTYVIENYVNFDPANISTTIGGGTHEEQDRVTGFAYNGNGSTVTLTAYNKSASTGDQATTYEYADARNTRLNTKVTYPDSSGANDVVTMTYNLDGSLATREDQRDVVLTYDYDSSRRVELEKATSIPSGVDNHVQSIGRAYDDYGRPTTVTSYAGTTTATTVRNQIEYTYNTYGLISDTDQEHSGAINGSTPEVDYDYETDHTSNVLNDGLRLDVMNLPLVANSKVSYFYSHSFSERLNRVRYTKLHGGNFYSGQTQTSKYEYNGTGRMVEIWAYTASGGGSNNAAKLTRFSGSDYDEFDRFGRVKTQKWYWSTTTHSQTDYVYDYNGNRTERDLVGTGTDGLDQLYSYDGLDRLTSMDQGTLSSGSITSKNFEQDFTLDQLGNWDNLTETDGTSTTLDQDRDHNEVNEIDTDTTHGDADNPITTTTGTNWADPIYDAAGNMTTMPRPNDLANSYTAEYDAWNRLVSLNNGSTDVQVNRYDGLHRRIIRDETGGSGDKRHFYYNEQWQCVTEGTESGGTITGDAIYSHHPHYIDAVAARMRSTDGHFYLHDANFNVVALMNLDSSKDVVERYHYSPYGDVTILDADYSEETGGEAAPDNDGLSDFSNELVYTGRRCDRETGLYQVRLRYLHVQTGRFLNRDPIRYFGGMNLYGYVGGAPTTFVDPLGLRGLTNEEIRDLQEFFGITDCELEQFLREHGFWRLEPEPKIIVIPTLIGETLYLTDEYFKDNLFGIPCVVCHGVCAQGVVGPPNSFKFGAPGDVQYYANLGDTAFCSALLEEASLRVAT